MAEPSPATPPLRMNAYYYSFDETGARPIDEILSAVAVAGKAYHLTAHWTDSEDGEPSQIKLICAAAARAAREFIALREMADAWESGGQSTVDFGNPHEEARFLRAVEAVRALRKGAGGG